MNRHFLEECGWYRKTKMSRSGKCESKNSDVVIELGQSKGTGLAWSQLGFDFCHYIWSSKHHQEHFLHTKHHHENGIYQKDWKHPKLVGSYKLRTFISQEGKIRILIKLSNYFLTSITPNTENIDLKKKKKPLIWTCNLVSIGSSCTLCRAWK